MTNTLQKISESILENIQLQEVEYEVEQKTLSERIRDSIKSHASLLSNEQNEKLEKEFFAHGPLDDLLCEENNSEVLIQAWNEIWIEKNGQLNKSDRHFLSPRTYQNILQKICEEAFISPTVERPYLYAKWREHRLTVISPPITKHSAISIRLHRNLHWKLNDLVQKEMISSSNTEIVLDSIKNKMNILIIGETGSGKTTFLNSCMNSIAENERAVILEDTSELSLPNSASQKLLTRNSLKDCYSEITLEDLVKISLRLRPDRLVVGEVRGSEAKDLLLAISSGHRGGFFSLHAENAKQALIRLEMLIQLGAPQWSLHAIRQLIYLSVDLIILVRREKSGQRKVASIQKITGLESFGLLLEELSYE